MKNLGRSGRISFYSDINHDRAPPSTQVWVELHHRGRVAATSSGNCALETGSMEADDGTVFMLTPTESAALGAILDLHEGK